jgi:uncharacterized protein involved in exopolysaccharide biosynthesis
MEIGAFLKGLLKKSWIVVLVVVLAAGGSYLLVRGTKDAYAATVDVTVPAAQAATAGSNGQYVANFGVGLTTATVLADVSKATGVPTATLAGGLTANQLGNSSFIGVGYSAGDPAKAEQVATAAAKATTALLAQPAVATATNTLGSVNKALTVADGQVKAAQTALSTYATKYGLVDPNVLYASTQSSITQLNVSKQQAIAQGRTTRSFDAAIAAEQTRLGQLAPQVVAYDALTRNLNQAQLAEQTAQSRVITASADLAAANAAPLIGAATNTLVPRNSTILQAVLIAAGLAFVLGFGLVLLLELLLATRRPRPDTAAGTGEPGQPDASRRIQQYA